MIHIEATSSIPYLGFLSDPSLSLKSLISEPGCTHRKEIFLLSLQKCAIFQYFAFLNRWVSLKERELTYSKFQHIFNSTRRGPKYITGTDRRTIRNPDFIRDKTSLSSEVPCFCSIFNSNRSSNFTNLLIHRPSLHSIIDVCSFVKVYIRALLEV
jgi:hypothetical protein